ncbi:MAG: carbon storage regulator [Phycisphaerales bacterium]|nr:carbon storage regulator [Phycisphaerales bacterium]
MLALSRGEGQSIIIDGHIEIKIVKWTRSSVRLAIQAPRDVSIDRDEVWRRMHPGAKSPLEEVELSRALRDACNSNGLPHDRDVSVNQSMPGHSSTGHITEPGCTANGSHSSAHASPTAHLNGQSANGAGHIK